MASFEVSDYGAVAGTADSTTAFQSALDACGAAGGGTVHVRDTYTISSSTSIGGLYACLSISYDDITIENEGTIICDTAGTAALFWISGAGKAARENAGDPFADWRDYSVLEFYPWGTAILPTTYYDLDPAGSFPKGSNSVTLDTAAEASNFVSGDWAVVRTGQTFDDQGGEPDGEFLQVIGANATTGEITFPSEPGLKTTYEQERYNDPGGTFPDGGISSTYGTGGSALFGIANVDDRLLWNTTIRGGTIDQRDPQFVYFSGQAMQMTVEDLFARCNTWGLDGGGRSRYRTVRNCEVAIYNCNSQYWISSDTLCTDYEWLNIRMVADAPTPLHINEGTGRLTADNVQMLCPSGTANLQIAGVRARHYDIIINECVVAGGGVVQIYVDAVAGGAGVLSGRVTGCEFINTTGAAAYLLGGTAPNTWFFDGGTVQGSKMPQVSQYVHQGERVQ